MTKKVLVVNGNGSYRNLATLFGEVHVNVNSFLKEPETYELVMFTGGEDVCPQFYGHSSPKGFCHYNIGRDLIEESVFITALEHNIAMTGICRGSQFLNALCGGWLMHHITGHGGDHEMETITGHKFNVTSTHHQMCVPSTDGFVLGWSKNQRSKFYFGDKDEAIEYDGPEVEAIYYPKKRVFAVQYHPEYMSKESDAYRWYKNGVVDLLKLTDFEFKNKYIGKVAHTASIAC